MVAEVVADADALFAVSYVTIILAVICWISDNALCDQLLHLPFGIPYPQTHSLWHVFTTWCVCLCARDHMRTRQHILECFVANVHACMLVAHVGSCVQALSHRCLYSMGLTLELCWRLVAHNGKKRLRVKTQGILPTLLPAKSAE